MHQDDRISGLMGARNSYSFTQRKEEQDINSERSQLHSFDPEKLHGGGEIPVLPLWQITRDMNKYGKLIGV